jgi:hypothetical protein
MSEHYPSQILGGCGGGLWGNGEREEGKIHFKDCFTDLKTEQKYKKTKMQKKTSNFKQNCFLGVYLLIISVKKYTWRRFPFPSIKISLDH